MNTTLNLSLLTSLENELNELIENEDESWFSIKCAVCGDYILYKIHNDVDKNKFFHNVSYLPSEYVTENLIVWFSISNYTGVAERVYGSGGVYWELDYIPSIPESVG